MEALDRKCWKAGEEAFNAIVETIEKLGYDVPLPGTK